MGYQGKRRREDHHEFRPRLNPVEQQERRLRRSIAEIGEPSRQTIGATVEAIADDLALLPEDAYGPVIQMFKAVIYEQPHKINFLAMVIELLDRKAAALAAVVIEMAHEELTHALQVGDYAKFKLFLRFVCALSPIIGDDGLEALLNSVIDLAKATRTTLGDYLYSSVVFAALYLQTPPSTELQEKLASYEAVSEPAVHTEPLFGEGKPYELQSKIQLLIKATQDLKETNWERNFLPDRSTIVPSLEKLAAEPDLFEHKEENGAQEETEQINEDGAKVTISETTRPDPETAGENSTEPKQDVTITEKIEDEAGGEQTEMSVTVSENKPEAETAAPAETSEAKGETPAENIAEAAVEAPAETKTETNGEAEEPKTETTVDADAESKSEVETDAKAEAEAEPAKKHRFPAVHIPEELVAPKDIANPGEWFTQIYLPNPRETVPPADDVFGLLLRDVATDNIRHMDFNRREVTRQLITLDLFFNSSVFAPPGVALDVIAEYGPNQATWKVEDVALESVLAQTLRLPLTEFPTTYFDTILIEACIMAPQAIAPVLGRALRFLFSSCEYLDAELLFRVVDWFSHHVSNFAFTWKWNEWIDSLDLPQNHPKQVFMRELLAKQVRLSYPQRVRDVLPQEFVHLVPEIPDPPDFSYENNEQVVKFQETLQSGSDADIEEAVASLKEEQFFGHALVTCVCNLGNRSLSHIAKWIEKTGELIKTHVPERVIVNAILEYRHDTVWIGMLILEEFAKQDIITAEGIVGAVVESRDLLLTAAGWEALLRHPEEAAARADSLTSLDKEEQWDNWWSQRLSRAIKRRAAASTKFN